MLALALIAGSFSAAFATDEVTGQPTDVTRAAIKEQGVKVEWKIEAGNHEVTAEQIAIRFADTVKEGGYELINTETLAGMVNNKEDVVIIDTMPEDWWALRHVPGAICSEIGKKGPAFLPEGTQTDDLYKAVKAAVGTKTKTYYWNGKKWTTKKPPKKYRGKSKKVWKYKTKKKKVRKTVKDYWARDDYVYDLGVF